MDRDTPVAAESLLESDSGMELTNDNSPLTAAEPPSPFSLKQKRDPASSQGYFFNVCIKTRLVILVRNNQN